VGLARFSISLFGAVAVVAATLAGTTIWLLLTDPVTVVDAVQSGEVSPLVKALATTLYDAMRGLLKYL
jgi:ABC-type cobalamin/Fe3+-siderophores transport system ATPase subunit